MLLSFSASMSSITEFYALMLMWKKLAKEKTFGALSISYSTISRSGNCSGSGQENSNSE